MGHDFAHLDVLNPYHVGSHRRDPLTHGLGGILRLEDDHPQTGVALSCPIPSYEPWGLRYPGYHLLAQMAFGDLMIGDRDRNDDCVRRGPLRRLIRVDPTRESARAGAGREVE